MSHNPSRSERSESTHYKRGGRSGSSNQHSYYSGGVSSKGGGGASSASSNPSYRSVKKYSSNAPGGQSRDGVSNVSTDSIDSSGAHDVQNGVHQLQPIYRASNASATNLNSHVRLTGTSTQNLNPALTRDPSSSTSSAAPPSVISASVSDAKPPTTPAKSSGDTSRSFPLQFGSISPGFMNGVQIPARTNSAPPNLDEQKKDQARNDTSNANPIPISSIPRQHIKKDAVILNQSSASEAQPVPKSRRDAQVSAPPPASQTHKASLLPIPGMHMHLPYHQPHVSAQFGGPNPQIQSQPMSGSSLPMPLSLPVQMPLPMGNTQVQQSIFVPGLQGHPMQSQGMMHQAQTLNFPSQISQQLPPHMGSGGMNILPHFPQHQAGKYNGSRKTVKITHPDTHEELRLDDSPGPRPHSNVLPQSQPLPPFPPNYAMNFFPNSYNASPFFIPAVGSVPLNTAQAPPSQPPRFYNQLAGKPVGSQGEKELLQPTSSLSVVKAESVKPAKSHVEGAAHPQREIAPSLSSSSQTKPGLITSSMSGISTGPTCVERDLLNISTAGAAATNGLASTPTISSADTNVISVSDSIESKHKISVDAVRQDQIDWQSTSLSSLPSWHAEAKATEAKTTLSGINSIHEDTKEFVPTSVVASVEASNLSGEDATKLKTGNTPKILGAEDGKHSHSNSDTILHKNRGEATVPEQRSLNTSLRPSILEPSNYTCKTANSSDQEVAATSDSLSEHTHQNPEDFLGCPHDDNSEAADDVFKSIHSEGRINIGSSVVASNLSVEDDRISVSDVSSSMPESIDVREATETKPLVKDWGSGLDSVSYLENALKFENEGRDNETVGFVSSSPATVMEKSLLDANLAKGAVPRGKMKKKELFRKAEASGTSSDMYVAYKGPEEKKDIVCSMKGTESTSNVSLKQKSSMLGENTTPNEEVAQSKVEPDDWEDAAEICSPQLETSKNENQGNDGDVVRSMTKRHFYTRDFLLTFCDKCTDLPEKFELASDIANTLLASSGHLFHESYPSPGRNVDRSTGGPRLERRGSGLEDDDKRNKYPGLPDVAYSSNIAGFRAGQGGNYGVPRNPRITPHAQYSGVPLSGLMQSLGSQGPMQRNNSDSDKWQRGSAFQKGLIPSPLTPLQMMHKAEKRYEVGRVTDEEEAKQRQLKAILNKLTPQNFQKLFEQVKQVNIDNAVTLTGVISQIFDKALMEPTFCEMYANFCHHLAGVLPNLSEDGEIITFKRLLLNKCQEEFEKGEKEEEEANKEEEGECEHTAEEREAKRLQARRRMLGNIRLIGELYKKRMLTERIMHECINKLLGQNQTPDEENIEALCKLMSTIGEMIDHSKAKEFMDVYFEMMTQLSDNLKLSSRVRFMLKDVIDLRKNNWQQRRKVEGPKMIDEVHRDAAQERQAQVSRLGRSPSFGGPVRRSTTTEFTPKPPNMPISSSSQMGGFRSGPPQRGYGPQDARIEERYSLENRAVSVPLPQRPLGDQSITLGPQGGLAKEMSFRGQPSAPINPLAEITSHRYVRRTGPGLNGFTTPNQTAYSQQEDGMPRHAADRITAPSISEQSYSQERSFGHGNRDMTSTDYGSDRSLPTSPSARGGHPINMQDTSSEMSLSEEHLRDKSMAMIKEYYSARDWNEVVVCIKDLNSPAFYPCMIFLWVTDCFERKDMERDLLTKLLINLIKSQDGLISEDQFTKGFEFVLAALEDSVNDAPRASEFLGRILAQVVLEKVVMLSEIGRLIYEGGEEKGRLVEIGLAAEVLGSVLEVIKTEKGDGVLNEIRSSSNLNLDNFRPPGSTKSWRIDKFIS